LIFLGDDITDARSRSRRVHRRQRIGNVTIERGLAVYVYALGHVRRIDAGKRPWRRICFFWEIPAPAASRREALRLV